MTQRLLAVALAGALLGGLAPAAEAAFVSKSQAREYLLRVVPRGAPRVMLDDKRAAFFRTDKVSVPLRGCHRRSAAAVSCGVTARLVPDVAHRKRNWWPISCRGEVLVRRLGDGTLQGKQGDYTCRTVRP